MKPACPNCGSHGLSIALDVACCYELEDVDDLDDLPCNPWAECIALHENESSFRVFCNECSWHHDFGDTNPLLDGLQAVLAD